MPRCKQELTWTEVLLAGLISAALLIGFSWGFTYLGPIFSKLL